MKTAAGRRTPPSPRCNPGFSLLRRRFRPAVNAGTPRRTPRGWKFRRGEQPGSEAAGFDDSGWESVRLPHDWAISGPFAAENDLQVTRIMQDGEMEETRHYGRTGALPHIGTGVYPNGPARRSGSNSTGS